MKKLILSVVFACITFVGNANAQTALLEDSILFNTAGSLSNTDSSFGGGFLATTSAYIQDTTSAPPANFYATMRSWVYANNENNPYGGLTFVYQFQNDIDSFDNIERMSISGFLGYKTAVAYSTTYAHTVMSSIDRSGNGGDVIGVSWAGMPGVSPGSYGFLAVYTDATSYGLNQAFIQDGGQAFTSVYAPVPEPEIYAMMAAGLGLMGFVARRRQRNGAVA